jgi:hypothetical protein
MEVSRVDELIAGMKQSWDDHYSHPTAVSSLHAKAMDCCQHCETCTKSTLLYRVSIAPVLKMNTSTTNRQPEPVEGWLVVQPRHALTVILSLSKDAQHNDPIL